MGRVSIVLYVVAALAFLLAGFGVDVARVTPFELVAFGLAAFAIGHAVP